MYFVPQLQKGCATSVMQQCYIILKVIYDILKNLHYFFNTSFCRFFHVNDFHILMKFFFICRVKLLLNVSCSSNNGGLTSSTPSTVQSTLLSTEAQNMTHDYTPSMTSSSSCADLHDSCAEFDLVYGICNATPNDSPLLYKQALEECKRTCKFC